MHYRLTSLFEEDIMMQDSLDDLDGLLGEDELVIDTIEENYNEIEEEKAGKNLFESSIDINKYNKNDVVYSFTDDDDINIDDFFDDIDDDDF